MNAKRLLVLLLILTALALFVLPTHSSLLNAQDDSNVPSQSNNSIFLPAISSNAQVVSSQSAQVDLVEPPPDDSPPDVAPTPRPDLPVLPEPKQQTQSFSYAESTPGQKIRLGNVDVQLPEDAYMDGLVVASDIYYQPGMKVEDYIFPPIAVLKRGDAIALVEIETGRIELKGETKEEQAKTRQAFDFLVQALGEDKIVRGNHEQ